MTDAPKPPHLFQKGKSGNPRGKPKGTRNKATIAVLALLESGAQEITQAILAAARGGDMSAARMVLDRLAPPARERPVSIDLPDTSTASGVAAAQAAILQAVAAGELTPGEASTLSGVLEGRRKAIETAELEQRITALEKRK